jgi:acyl-CoA thioesterase
VTSARTEASAFERATAVLPLAAGRWTAEADPGWFAVRGPNGGYLAAIVLRAMAAEVGTAGRHPRSLTLHYTRPPLAGALEIDVTVERAGRRLSTVTARVLQDDRLCVLATAAFSEDFDAITDYADPAPEVPRSEAVEPVPQERAIVPIAQRFEVRPALGHAPFSEAGEAPLDPFALAMLTDAWIPSPFVRAAAPFAAPTVDLTIYFRAPEAIEAWPALVVFRSRFAHGGFFEEDGEIWSADGRLLAQSRQLGLMG